MSISSNVDLERTSALSHTTHSNNFGFLARTSLCHPKWIPAIVALIGLSAIFFASYASSLNLIHPKDASFTLVIGSCTVLSAMIAILKRHHKLNPIQNPSDPKYDNLQFSFAPEFLIQPLPSDIKNVDQIYAQNHLSHHSHHSQHTNLILSPQSNIHIGYTHSIPIATTPLLFYDKDTLFGIHAHTHTQHPINAPELSLKLAICDHSQDSFNLLCEKSLPKTLSMSLLYQYQKGRYLIFNRGGYQTVLVDTDSGQYAICASALFWRCTAIDNLRTSILWMAKEHVAPEQMAKRLLAPIPTTKIFPELVLMIVPLFNYEMIKGNTSTMDGAQFNPLV